MRLLPREAYIPNGARKVVDKTTQSVAYLYEIAGKPCAVVFAPKALKPAWRYRFLNNVGREQRIREFFEARRAHDAAVAERRAKRSAFEHAYEVGDILVTRWGYDQTNREWFEIVALYGRTGVIVREIAGNRGETDGWTGHTVPQPGRYIAEPLRRKAAKHGIRIDDIRTARLAETETVGGVKVVKPVAWTAYA